MASDNYNYPSNSLLGKKNGPEPKNERPSRKDRPERTREAVVESANTKKTGFLDRIFDRFIQAEPKDVLDYLWDEVIEPAAQETLFNIFQGGAGMFFLGERRGRRSGVNVRNYNPTTSTVSREPQKATSAARKILEEIVYDTKTDAMNVRDGLLEYDVASVKDLYELSNMKTDWTKDKWGWVGLTEDDIRITRIPEGWILELPRPKPID